MIRRRLWISLLGIVIVAVLLLGINLIARNEPVLGLDLQGGVSVVLATDEDASASDLTFIRDLIRDELESRGIAEPDVRVEGENIVVDLPGVKDQRQALDAVDVAGIVSLRPVVSPCTAPVDPNAVDSSVPESTDVSGTNPGTTDEAGAETTSGDTTDATDVSGTTAAATTDAAGFRRPADTDTTIPDTTAPDTTTAGSTEPPESSAPTESSEPTESTVEETTTTTTIPLGPLGVNPLDTIPPSPYAPAPPSSDDSTIELPTRDGLVCTVGPVQRGPNGEAGGFVFAKDSAKAVLDNTGGWQVTVDLSAEGSGTFNQLADACFNDPLQGGQTCPTGQLAIVMDDEIVTYPQVRQANFPGEVSITGNFSESEARDLARVLDRGAFPVQVHAETVQTVSATLGEDSMRAAVFAGLAGITLVLLLLAYFYRRLILVVVAGVAVWGMLIFSAATFISETTNYALTLAGVTGIIVAIGVTVDTYVVYFERMKEEVRHGRTIRNSALRSFKATWRTIVAADFVALIAAVVLFILSVGSVRGFALYLGITTVCDLVVCFFFTRPAVGLLAESGWLDRGDTFGLKEYE
jgi:preprotein translocase subunit SecD